MGLEPSDYLVISLSSINPGEGQLQMVQAALTVAEGVGDEGRVDLTQNIDETGTSNSLKTLPPLRFHIEGLKPLQSNGPLLAN